MNRSPAPSLLPNDHEQRIAAIREKAQRHAQRSARLFAPPPEPEDSDLPVPSLLAVACSVALANQAQAATPVSNEVELSNALNNKEANIELTQDISNIIWAHRVDGSNIDGKNHTVELNGKVFLSGPNQRIGNISNITIQNGAHLGGFNGGIIDGYIGSRITGDITNSHFKNSRADNSGGAILISAIDGSIKNSHFIGNTAINSHGGALYVVDDITGGIEGSHFEGNNAKLNGGAMDIATLTGGIRNSQFIDNHSQTGTGGALWVHYGSGVLGGISGSTFERNSAGGTHGGGAVSVKGTINNGIQNSIFRDNKSLNTNAYSSGGAIRASVINGGISSGSVFEGNTAESHGGAIYTVNGIRGGISDAIFENNTSTSGHGGAIATSGTIIGDINNVTFSNNKTSATGSGGAIVVIGSGGINGSIIDSTFTNNSAGDGAGLHIRSLAGEISNTKFINNTAHNPNTGGGAIIVDKIYGGIKNGSVFKDNTSHGSSGGGAIFVNTIDNGISDSTFTGNNAIIDQGGAIHAQVNISGGITDSTFTENNAGTSGGAIAVGSSGLIGGITGSYFEGNTADSSGGAIYATGNIMDGMTGGTVFEKNTATTGSGGAIYANSITGDITATFSENTAGVHGGALYLAGATGNNTIINSVFTGNTAGDMGGAVFQETGGTLTVSGSQFLGNTAKYSGGAIKSANLYIKNSAFIGNQGIDNSGRNNSATGLGTGLGGAVLIQGQLDVEDSIFLGNSSAYRGAAIHHHHDKPNTTQRVNIIGGANKTLFYGNQETDTGRYSSIEFSHTRDNLGDVTIHADKGVEGNSGVLMLDAMQSVNNPSVSYTAGSVLNITKAGDGDWFLGGDNRMLHPGDWLIKEGRLALTDVDYDGSGASQAQINLTSGHFSLANGAVLEGRGIISASEISLSGTINPNIWRNSGMLAKDITTGITQADIDSIQTVADKADSFATITLDTQGSGNAVKMDWATYEVGVAWKDNGSGGFDAQSDLLDIKGGLDVKNSSINITRLDFDHDWALARVAGGGTEPAAQVIQTTDGITGDFKVEVAGTLAPSSDFLKVRGEQSGNNYEVKVGLSWYSKERDGSRTAVSGNSVLDAHGGFTIAAGNDFTLDGALGKRTDAVNFQDETSESGGSKGWDGNSLTKRGDGTLILNADNTYDGLTTIEAGKLVLGDSTAKASARVGGDVQINTGAIFDGYGTAKGNVTVDNGGQFTGFGGAEGLVHVKNGGLLAPGSATEMGTINAGSLQMDAGSTYRVKTDTTGAADHIQVANDVTLHGGTVDVRARDGNWGKRGTQHTPRSIIQAGGTLTGAFDNVTTDLAFLTPKLDYNNGHVMLGLTRNSTKMEDIADGTTHNRMSAAEGLAYLEASGANPTLMNELLGLNKDDALRAFDSLSGEIYPTTKTVLMQSSRQLRMRVNTRLTANTQGTDEAPSFNAIRALGTGDTGASTPVWVSAWGHNGNQGSTPNAAHADISGHGVVVGMDNTDRPLAGGLHAGVMFGSESTKVQVADGRDSRSEVDSRSAGVYGGSAIGNTQWRGGLIYSHLDVETQRTVTVNSLTEHLQSERKGKQMQAFAEISHNLTLSPRTSVAPWLNVAKVWQRLDAAQEGNGATALELEKQSASATTVSVGGRGQVSLGDGRTPVSVYADVGYQYVIDGKNTDSKHHFAGQPQDFAVRGTSLNDSLVGAVGVQLGLSRNSALLVEYRGELGSGQQQHVGNVSWQVKF